MKKCILCLVIAVLAINVSVNAQEEDKFRFDFQLGWAVPQQGGGGLAFNIEPKWNIADNMAVGLRIGGAALIKEIEFSDVEETSEAEVGVNGSYLGTFDYYYTNLDGSFAPFVGGGLGYFAVANIGVDEGDTGEAAGVDASGKFGGMLRTGFDWGKFRLVLDYNLVGRSDLQDFNGNVIGETQNGYLGITIGFFLGGGKWGR